MSPFRLFGRPDTEAGPEAPPAEHAAWYGGAADPPPAYRPPHSGGSAAEGRRKPRRGPRRAAQAGPPARAESASWAAAGTRWAAGSTPWGAAPPRPGAAAGSHRGAPAPPPLGIPATAPWDPPGNAATPWDAPGAAATPPPPGAGRSAAGRRSGATTASDGAAAPPPRDGDGSAAPTPWGATASGGADTPAVRWYAAPGGASAGWSTADHAAIPWGTAAADVPAGRRSASGGPRNGHGPGTPTGPWGGPLTSGDPRVNGDPPTDPRGFPPVPAFAPIAPHPAEAAALAGAFAVDYLSWDEDDPERRGRVLVDYLPTPGRDPARLGWSGKGRQRAEFALPGLVRSDGDGRVLVDVRVRVTPYAAVGTHRTIPEPTDANVPGALAAAPAPTGRGWRSLASTWIRLSVPVTFDGGRMVIDAWDETLGEEPPTATRPAAGPDDHTLVDDDPLQEPATGGTP